MPVDMKCLQKKSSLSCATLHRDMRILTHATTYRSKPICDGSCEPPPFFASAYATVRGFFVPRDAFSYALPSSNAQKRAPFSRSMRLNIGLSTHEDNSTHFCTNHDLNVDLPNCVLPFTPPSFNHIINRVITGTLTFAFSKFCVDSNVLRSLYFSCSLSRAAF